LLLEVDKPFNDYEFKNNIVRRYRKLEEHLPLKKSLEKHDHP
jgi:hypothetical protein